MGHPNLHYYSDHKSNGTGEVAPMAVTPLVHVDPGQQETARKDETERVELTDWTESGVGEPLIGNPTILNDGVELCSRFAAGFQPRVSSPLLPPQYLR